MALSSVFLIVCVLSSHLLRADGFKFHSLPFRAHAPHSMESSSPTALPANQTSIPLGLQCHGNCDYYLHAPLDDRFTVVGSGVISGVTGYSALTIVDASAYNSSSSDFWTWEGVAQGVSLPYAAGGRSFFNVEFGSVTTNVSFWQTKGGDDGEPFNATMLDQVRYNDLNIPVGFHPKLGLVGVSNDGTIKFVNMAHTKITVTSCGSAISQLAVQSFLDAQISPDGTFLVFVLLGTSTIPSTIVKVSISSMKQCSLGKTVLSPTLGNTYVHVFEGGKGVVFSGSYKDLKITSSPIDFNAMNYIISGQTQVANVTMASYAGIPRPLTVEVESKLFVIAESTSDRGAIVYVEFKVDEEEGSVQFVSVDNSTLQWLTVPSVLKIPSENAFVTLSAWANYQLITYNF